MSVDVDWDRLTGGPDGEVLAEAIRSFIDERFQRVTLPKMIRKVTVESFEFGSIAPELELKDVCDPLRDFYEDEEEDDDDPNAVPADDPQNANDPAPNGDEPGLSSRRPTLRSNAAPPAMDTQVLPASATRSPPESVRPPLTRSSTPGIPGGTSNMSYFHLPLSAGLSGAATPFGAFGGPQGWLDQAYAPWHHHDTSSNARTKSSPTEPDSNMQYGKDRLQSIPESTKGKGSEDLQIVAHVRYSGDVKLTLAADILLDYPMPSFVGIPLQLKVTGMTFDGIAIIAYIKHKAHFCFLSPEDADALIGGEGSDLDEDLGETEEQEQDRKPPGKLFEQIRVESEIGRRANGKQVLKNVSKVEKFVLEQVRKIFETEFVYPSFWTFLV